MKMLCKFYGGSHAYGLNTPESDLDERGVFMNTELPYLIGTKNKELFENTADGADEKYREVKHFLQLLKKSNTECFEALFNNNFEYVTPEFKQLQVHKEELLDSRNAFNCLRGYMKSELRLAIGERKGQLGGKRKAALDKFGFSPKNFTQLYRLSYCGSVLFQKGYFPVNIKDEDKDFHKFLMEVKTKPFNFKVDTLNELAKEYEDNLIKSYESRKFEYSFNDELANEFLLKLYYPYLKESYSKLLVDKVL